MDSFIRKYLEKLHSKWKNVDDIIINCKVTVTILVMDTVPLAYFSKFSSIIGFKGERDALVRLVPQPYARTNFSSV